VNVVIREAREPDPRGLAQKVREWIAAIHNGVEQVAESWQDGANAGKAWPTEEEVEKDLEKWEPMEGRREPVPWSMIVSERIHDSGPAMEQLWRLRDIRAAQFGMRDSDPEPPIIFEGNGPHEFAMWTERFYPLPDTMSPHREVHALIVGTPQEIPFEFQALLDSVISVGRLDFSERGSGLNEVTDREVGRLKTYVDKIEKSQGSRRPPARAMLYCPFVSRGKDAEPLVNTMWNLAAGRLLALPMLDRMRQRYGSSASRYLFGKSATTNGLLLELANKSEPYTLLFSANHGTPPDFANTSSIGGTPDFSAIGGLRGWEGNPLEAREVERLSKEDSLLNGGIWFQFGCYSVGVPTYRDNGTSQKGDRYREGFVAELPKALLSHPNGPIAFIGHLDTTSYLALLDTIEPLSQQPAYLLESKGSHRNALIRRANAFKRGSASDDSKGHRIRDRFGRRREAYLRAVEELMDGKPAGVAVAGINKRVDVLSAAMNELLNFLRDGRLDDDRRALPWLADSLDALADARNWFVLGDPAASLRPREPEVSVNI
jgi:hypothetical protein